MYITNTRIMNIRSIYVSQRLIDELESQPEDYTDNALKEHLYGIELLSDLLNNDDLRDEVQIILDKMDVDECAYLRIFFF